MFKIVTKKGDGGDTFLLFNRKVQKSDRIIKALGKIDTLNAHIGKCLAVVEAQTKVQEQSDIISKDLQWVQSKMFLIMGQVGIKPADNKKYQNNFGIITKTDVDFIDQISEKYLSILQKEGYDMKHWICYGLEGEISAEFDLAAKLCREVECNLNSEKLHIKDRNSNILIFINRFSDLLFLMARILRKR